MNDNLLKVLLGWMQNFLSDLQEWFGKGAFDKLSRHWILWVILLIAAGFIIDKVVYFFRFRPDRRVKEAVRSFRSVMDGEEETEEKKDEINEYGYVSYKEEVPQEQEEEEYVWEPEAGSEEGPAEPAAPAPSPVAAVPVQGKIQDRELDPKPDTPVPIGVYHGPRQSVPFGVYTRPSPVKENPETVPSEKDAGEAGSQDSFELENMRDLSQPSDPVEPGQQE